MEYLGLYLAGLNHTSTEDLSASVLKPAALGSLIYPMVSHKVHALAPLLFTIYAGKLFEIVKAHLPDVHAYADDTQLCLSFKPDSEDNQIEAVDSVREYIEEHLGRTS